MKKVVLIGDSIRINYCELVREDLKGEAEVLFPPENCRFIQYLYQNLGWWMDSMGLKTEEDRREVAAVHWNSGHWDTEHYHPGKPPLNPIPVYEDMLRRTEEYIEETFPNARVFFATTTPMNPDRTKCRNMRTTETIAEYNDAAVRALAGTRAEIDDLWDLVIGDGPEIYLDYCHFNDVGSRKLADRVTGLLRETL